MQLSRTPTVFVTVVLCVLVSSKRALGQVFGDACTQDTGCHSRCCSTYPEPAICTWKSYIGVGQDCYTEDGCDCEDDLVCNSDHKCEEPPTPPTGPDVCTQDSQCSSECCANGTCTEKSAKSLGEDCFTGDGCDCEDELVCNADGKCGELCFHWDGECLVPIPIYVGDDEDCGGICDETKCCTVILEPSSSDNDYTTSTEPTPTPAPHHEPTPTPEGGGGVEGDPHMQGLRGQRINWSGVDGGWYSLIKDDVTDFDINVRVTAPLPDEFPDRQLVTSLAVMSKGHSLVIEVQNPYTTDTDGCPEGVSPCLANGGLRIFVDDQEANGLLQFSRQVSVGDGAISVSATNLPVECRKFGGHKIWGRMYQEMLEGRRRLDNSESFEDWILKSNHMPAPRWCAKYIAENDLADMQSTHAIFKIESPTLTVRLDAGVNYQGDGELDWDGRVLPDLDFWQMDVLVDGLDVENPALSGLLGETARPMYDENGNEVMAGFEAFRGTIEDYRVSSALGVHFPLLDEKEKVEGHE